MSHVNGTSKADHLTHVSKSTTVIEMKVTDDHTVKELIKWSISGDVRQVREPPVVIESHVHTAVKHDILPSDREKDATSTDVLPCSCFHQKYAIMQKSFLTSL